MVARPTSAATSWRICRTASPMPVTGPLPRTRILVIGRPLGGRLVLRRLQSSTREGRLGQTVKGLGRVLRRVMDLVRAHVVGDLDTEAIRVVAHSAGSRSRAAPRAARRLRRRSPAVVEDLRLCPAPRSGFARPERRQVPTGPRVGAASTPRPRAPRGLSAASTGPVGGRTLCTAGRDHAEPCGAGRSCTPRHGCERPSGQQQTSNLPLIVQAPPTQPCGPERCPTVSTIPASLSRCGRGRAALDRVPDPVGVDRLPDRVVLHRPPRTATGSGRSSFIFAAQRSVPTSEEVVRLARATPSPATRGRTGSCRTTGRRWRSTPTPHESHGTSSPGRGA